MSQQNRKCQHLEEEQQEGKEDTANRSIVEINSENLEMIQAHGNAISSNQKGNDTTTKIIGHGNGNGVNELEISHLKAKVQMLETEKQQLTQKLASVEEQYKKEIVELKVRLTNQNEAFQKKLKALEERMQMNQQNFGENENQNCLPKNQMKMEAGIHSVIASLMANHNLAKSQLPLENWFHLLASVPRSQLGNVVSQIGHRQFAHIIQSFLHEHNEITLGQMWIIAPRPSVCSDRPMVKVRPHAATNVPDCPMSGNVKNFIDIYLEYLNVSVLNFMREFQDNSLLDNVNLKFSNLEEDILLRVLPQILPLISSIDSIDSLDICLFRKIYKDNNGNGNRNEWSSQLPMLKTMMAQTRILYLRGGSECLWEDKVDWFCRWLYTPRDDGKPRMLFSYFSESAHCSSFVERIKKDFVWAHNTVSFFILLNTGNNGNLRGISFSAENVKTDEKLVIKDMEFNEWYITLMVSRHPLKAAKKWIEANEEEIFQWDTKINPNRRIILDEELAIAM